MRVVGSEDGVKEICREARCSSTILNSRAVFLWAIETGKFLLGKLEVENFPVHSCVNLVEFSMVRIPVIREVGEEDAASVTMLLNKIIEKQIYTAMDQKISVEEELAFIRSFPECGVFHGAFLSNCGKLVGIQDVVSVPDESEKDCRIGEISTFVSLTTQREGIGRCLSMATFQAVREKGFQKLNAAVRADNRHALAFYESQGFQRIEGGKRQVLVRGRYVDVVLAEKFLD